LAEDEIDDMTEQDSDNQITGCAVAPAVLTAIGLVNGNPTYSIRPHTESTSLNQLLQNLAQVITSTTTTAVQNLVEICS